MKKIDELQLIEQVLTRLYAELETSERELWNACVSSPAEYFTEENRRKTETDQTNIVNVWRGVNDHKRQVGFQLATIRETIGIINRLKV